MPSPQKPSSRRSSPGDSSREDGPHAAATPQHRDTGRHGSPGFQFVTATSLEQLREKEVMRNIRQHVMLNHVKQRKQASSPRERPLVITRGSSSSESAEQSSGNSSQGGRLPNLEDHMSSFSIQVSQPSLRSSAIKQSQDKSRPSSRKPSQPTDLPKLSYFQRRIDRSWSPLIDTTSEQSPPITPLMLNIRTTCVASAYQDVLDGQFVDSDTTLAIKSRFLEVLNNSLENASWRTSNYTEYAALELLLSEMLSGNTAAIRAHSHGLDMIVHQKGGLWSLDSSANAGSVISETMMLAAILNGTVPRTEYIHFAIQRANPEGDEDFKSFSPLDLSTQIDSIHEFDDKCSAMSRNILVDMQKLTAGLLSHSKVIARPSVASYPAAAGGPQDFQNSVATIQGRLFELPSVSEAAEPSPRSWVYEAVRLAALMYTTSILYGTSFYDGALNLPYCSPHCSTLESLSMALAHTDLNEDWRGISGCLFWVALVGAAAAHNPRQESNYIADVDLSSRRIFMIALVNALGRLTDDGTEAQQAWVLRSLLRMLQVQQALSFT